MQVGLRAGRLSGMMPRMAEAKSMKRLTESVPGRLVGWLLALLWVFSLSGVDSTAFSAFPVCVVLLAVLLLVFFCLLLGYRVVRMSALGWFSLAAGGYFLCRCLNSYAVVDSWADSVLIVVAAVYYLAGVYVAQNRHYSAPVIVLVVALLLSALAWWAVKQPWFCLEWTGRATYTPAGRNSMPTALLVYKNFAGFFFIAGAVALGGWALWAQRGIRAVLLCVVAVLSVLLSFFCGTRAPFFLAPIVLMGLWVFDVLVQLYSGRKISVLSYVVCAVFVVLLLVGVYDFFFGRTLSVFFDDTDSHGRYGIWSAVCEVLSHAPAWGCGAASVQWETIPFYKGEYLANMAHNEYLQVWADYGFIGLGCMLAIIAWHVVAGLRCVASDKISPERRALTSVSLLVLVFASAYATSDFPWHSVALVIMCAFVCGVLSSPFPYVRDAHKWSASSQAPVVGVQAQGKTGKLLLLALVVGVGFWCVWLGQKLYPVWYNQWEYNRLSQSGEDAYAHKRRELIAALLPGYPDSDLIDTYFLLPAYGSDWHERERLLRIALEANPKQMFVVAMLAEVLGKQKRYEDAEQLLRTKYTEVGLLDSGLHNWPAVYAHNLVMWAREDMGRGQYGLALSKMKYALEIHRWKNVRYGFVLGHKINADKKKTRIKPWLKDVMMGCKRDVRMLELLQVRPDDSWRLPLTPGGIPSLYSSIVDKSQQK